MSVTDKNPLKPGADESVCWNFNLLAHHQLDGFGGMGEGMSIQIAPDGRRIIWLAHESAPKNFTAVDVSDPRKPSKPSEVGRWWLPGTREGDSERPPARQALDKGNRAHNTNVYPQRPDRCYLGYIDAGMFIMDISDKSKPKPIARWDNSPPYTGFTHTVLPLFERELLVVTDESTEDGAKDWPKLIWLLDAREETKPIPIATCPMP